MLQVVTSRLARPRNGPSEKIEEHPRPASGIEVLERCDEFANGPSEILTLSPVFSDEVQSISVGAHFC